MRVAILMYDEWFPQVAQVDAVIVIEIARSRDAA